jgi:glutathione S-transferase
MKLYNSPLSPFARKCRIVALELGLADSLELVAQSVSPVTPDAKYLQNANPLGKIPALLLDDGRALYDSHVICEYLCALAGDTRLVPAGDARWDVLTRQALASGMTDAIILVRYETALRPEALRWADWSAGQTRKFEEGLAQFEATADRLDGPLDLAQIALACALAYTDARFPDLGWRARAPAVARWHAEIERRPHFVATAPTA